MLQSPACMPTILTINHLLVRIGETISVLLIRIITWERSFQFRCLYTKLGPYKTLHNINPIYVKDYFLPKAINHNLRLKNPVEISKVRTTNYGIRSLSFQGPKIWNSLPDETKTAQNTKKFKNLIKTWFLSNKCA